MNVISMNANMSTKQNLSGVFTTEQRITVAGFAKVAVDPQPKDEYLNDQIVLKYDYTEPLKEGINESGSSELEKSSIPNQELDKLEAIEIDSKLEVLKSHDVESVEQSTLELQHNDVISLQEESNNEIENSRFSSISSYIQFIEYFENLLQDDTAENISELLSRNNTLLKNPLAVRKKSEKHSLNNVKTNQLQGSCLDNIIKSESPSETACTSEFPVTSKTATESQIIIKEETVQSSINLDELLIKPENLCTSEEHQETYIDANLKYNTLSCNLDSSLDVNLSHEDTDFEDAISKQSLEDVKSNVSMDTIPESTKYFSFIDITPAENSNVSVQNSQSPQNVKKKLPHRKNKRRTYKLNAKNSQNEDKKKNEQSKSYYKAVGRKRKTKTKCTTKDCAYKSGFSQKTVSKNVAKSGIKTRKKRNKRTDKNTSALNTDDFPRPFKSEPAALNRELAIELPKPIRFKRELEINIRNKKSYLKPEFQPCVKLKRLKSEDLLVPLKTKHVRKIRKFRSTAKHFNYHQMANDNKRDILIHRAYSLNPCIKSNRTDHNHSYNEHLRTSYEMMARTPNASIAESKYFNPRELYELFQSSTSNSGVSTSTPSTSQQSSFYNKTLLLQIAAERAFINNHLMHFGYSPVQFDLYNNPNDLNVFLKYLMGNVNTI